MSRRSGHYWETPGAGGFESREADARRRAVEHNPEIDRVAAAHFAAERMHARRLRSRELVEQMKRDEGSGEE